LLIYGIKKLKLALVHCVGNGVGMSNRRNSFAIRQWTNYLLDSLLVPMSGSAIGVKRESC